MLTIRELSKTYDNGVRALNRVSLEVDKGMFGLLGPNGAGKSSLMRILATLQEPDQGTAQLDDINILEDKESLRRVLGYLPQDFGVYPKISPAAMLDHFIVLKGITGKGERKEIAEALLHQTNLYDVRNSAIDTFSGGMKQRVAIARALVSDPSVVLLDEPFSALDVSLRRRMQDLMLQLWRDTSKTMVMVTHNIEEAIRVGHRVIVLGDVPARVLIDTSTADATYDDRYSANFLELQKHIETIIY